MLEKRFESLGFLFLLFLFCLFFVFLFFPIPTYTLHFLFIVFGTSSKEEANIFISRCHSVALFVVSQLSFTVLEPRWNTRRVINATCLFLLTIMNEDLPRGDVKRHSVQYEYYIQYMCFRKHKQVSCPFSEC